MKYVLMLCSDVAFRDDLEDAAIETGCANWSADLARRGILQGSTGLRPATDATRTTRWAGGVSRSTRESSRSASPLGSLTSTAVAANSSSA